MVPPDDYFVLGDHRNSSSDSRSWGFVDRRRIYGRAVLVYWPFDKIGRVR
jgi:signal peptidase I